MVSVFIGSPEVDQSRKDQSGSQGTWSRRRQVSFPVLKPSNCANTEQII